MSAKKDTTKPKNSILGAISRVTRRKKLEASQEERAETFADLLEKSMSRLERIITEEELKATNAKGQDNLMKSVNRLTQLKLIENLLGMTIEECAVFAENHAGE